jgi:LysM repeat protein
MIEHSERRSYSGRGGYSPERSVKVAGAAGLGSMLALAGLFMSSGRSSAAQSVPVIAPVLGLDASGAQSLQGGTDLAGGQLKPLVTVVAATAATAGTSASACGTTYVVLPGDFWLRIAHKTSVSVNQLYAANNATAHTAIHPGETICLPAGAVVQAVATVTAPPTATTTATTAAPRPTTPTTVKATPPPTVRVTTTTAKPAPPTTKPKTTTHGSRP